MVQQEMGNRVAATADPGRGHHRPHLLRVLRSPPTPTPHHHDAGEETRKKRWKK